MMNTPEDLYKQNSYQCDKFTSHFSCLSKMNTDYSSPYLEEDPYIFQEPFDLKE
jgi:hypothetical protein